MITPEKIEEWLHEVEERPSAGLLIIQYIAGRLRELTGRNEVLLDENIELRSGRKVEEYEARIANLEYQVELLKRQLGGAVLDTSPIADAALPAAPASLLVYAPNGKALRVEMDSTDPASAAAVARFPGGGAAQGMPLSLLATFPQEELLFVFDSGRAVTRPVSAIPPASGTLDWGQAFFQEPRGSEELAAVIPVGRMSLYDTVIQTSRRGYVKKLRESFFESCIAKGFVGSGVKLPADKTFNFILCNKADRFIMLSQEGYLFSMEVNNLPVTIDEALRLSASDHIVAAFVAGQKPSVLIVTQNGRVIHREAGWVEASNALKSKGQPVFSRERREAGVRVVGAAAVDENDWGVALRSDGAFTVRPMADIFSRGSLLEGEENVAILAFAALPLKP